MGERRQEFILHAIRGVRLARLFVGRAKQRLVVIGQVAHVASQTPHDDDADGDGDGGDDEREHHGADVLNLPHEHGSQHTDSGKRCDDEAPELRPSVTAHA